MCIRDSIRDYDQVIAELERFLPLVDNWATCDTMSPAVFKRNLTRLHPQCLIWMGDAHPYTVRFGTGMLMRYFLDGAFDPSDLELVASVRSEAVSYTHLDVYKRQGVNFE